MTLGKFIPFVDLSTMRELEQTTLCLLSVIKSFWRKNFLQKSPVYKRDNSGIDVLLHNLGLRSLVCRFPAGTTQGPSMRPQGQCVTEQPTRARPKVSLGSARKFLPGIWEKGGW